ncbi:MAG: cytochrome c oxidase subunit II [Myxococcota bacterium]|jgi:cytochrome c oxidase subunit 2|nr:cytochrome C oxidase subunit II [Deltaproteobacteria bacterium]MCP4240975.1 cytochrome c oxidase subunit II [bacterium]MDP6074980.1 cytochrome c oxidase subunit II [Myxococcota bacterium]MDP6243942.1 cytochrome c oxidase subunit II [Myxococcota bacterium]MDP7076261.1 cytochrome c oxidase subunit II [Myxococcota bacterium]
MIESLVPAASTYAGDIDDLFTLIFVLVGFWFVLSEVTFFWLILRFRKKPGVAGQHITGEKKQEKRWITWPHILVLVCDVFIIVGAVKVWYDIKQYLPPPQETVRVVSQQWAWTFVHPGPDGELDTGDDVTKMNELHVKVGTIYHYLLESKDVIHDFSVPVFRLKQDAVPGRVITGWFEPTKTGEWDIQCAEICGIGHALMGGRIFIETPEQHAAWLAEHGAVSVAAFTPSAVEE